LAELKRLLAALALTPRALSECGKELEATQLPLRGQVQYVL